MAVRQGALVLAAAVVLSAGAARAQVVTQSPRRGALKFKLGNYNPSTAVSSESGLTGNPYHETFGNSGMLLFETSYDWYVWQKFGAAGVGFTAGYAEKYAPAKAAGTGEASAEKAGFRILPLKLAAVYNFDYPMRTWGVPLVPYGRLGLAWTGYHALKGGEVERLDTGRKFEGAKWGYAATLGLAFQLDVLEPRMAHDFDTDLGVNHSYFFAEWNRSTADNFGGGGLNLTANYWMFGLALEL